MNSIFKGSRRRGRGWEGSSVLQCIAMCCALTWLIHMWRDSIVRDDSFIFNTTHSYVTWLLHVTWLIHMRHDSFICDMTFSHVTWLTHMWQGSCICDMIYSYMTRLIHIFSSYVTACCSILRSLIFVCEQWQQTERWCVLKVRCIVLQFGAARCILSQCVAVKR